MIEVDYITGDQPNTCPHDGTRTEMLEDRDDHTVELCQLCKRQFNFWHDADQTLYLEKENS